MNAYGYAVQRRLAALGFVPVHPDLPVGVRPWIPLCMVRSGPGSAQSDVVAVLAADDLSPADRTQIIAELCLAVAEVNVTVAVAVVHVFAGGLSAAVLAGLDQLAAAGATAHWVADLETGVLMPVGDVRFADTRVRVALDPQAVLQDLMAAERRTRPTDRGGHAAGDGSGGGVHQRMELSDRRPYVTLAVLLVIGAMFLLAEALGGSENVSVLRALGAKYAPFIVERGETWRLVTAMFLHAGLTHVLLNGMVLYYMGRLVETLYGHWRFLFIYFLGGLCGSLASLYLGGYETTGVGASGAIFGLFGAVIYVRLAWPHTLPMSWGQVLWPVAVNLMVGVIIPQVDNWAHLGGLAGGLVSAAVAGTPGALAAWRRVVVPVALAAAWLLVLGWVPLGWPW